MSVTQNRIMKTVKKYLGTFACPTIIDVGAYTGNIIKETCSELSIYRALCIEACPKNFELLKKNLFDHPHISPVNLAIASHEGYVKLYVANHDDLDGSSQSNSLHKDFLANKVWAKIKKKKIPCLTLDKFCDEYDIRDIHYLKINCEGCEFDIFDSPTKDFLEYTSVIYLELHGKCHRFNSKGFVKKKKKIMEELEQSGFRMVDGNRNVHEKKHIEQLWVKKELELD